MTMNKLITLSVFALTGAPALAMAAPAGLLCGEDSFAAADQQPGMLDANNEENFDSKDAMKFKDTGEVKWVRPLDCFRDEVLVLDGDQKTAGGQPLYTCGEPMKPDFKKCNVDARAAAARALEVIKAKGGTYTPDQWDQFVILGANIQPESSSDKKGPLFIREGYGKMAAMPGVSDVGGIGLTRVPRVNDRPFVGIIDAGGTGSAGSNAAKGEFAPCGTAPRRDTDTHAVYKNDAACFPRYYTFFDALAQQTGALYGPYLGEFDTGLKNGMEAIRDVVSVPPSIRPNVTATSKDFLNVRVWNAFFNTGGSLFGGNSWRNNGNGTWDLTKPTPYYGVNPPYGRAGSETGVSPGAQILRFQPFDLYLLGFLPLDRVGPDHLKRPQAQQVVHFFSAINNTHLYRPIISSAFPAESGTIGPGMGIRLGVSIRPPLTVEKYLYQPAALLQGLTRDPAPEMARQFIRQLWIVVSRPKAIREDGFKASTDAFKDAKALAKLENDAFKHVETVQIWRRQWNHYFYMLAAYKGRVTTTYEADVNDAAYFEFGDQADDMKQFQAVGDIELTFPEYWEAVSPTEQMNALKVQRMGDGAGITSAAQDATVPKLRIETDQNLEWPTNAVTVRMRVAPGAVPKDAFAEIEFTGGATPIERMRIPSTCGNDPDATDAKNKPCVEAGTLVADGKWRNYSASLVGKNSEFLKNPSYTGFTFYPSNLAAESPDGTTPAIEIEFIRISNVGSAADSDTMCDLETPQPDGWVDSEDNCKDAYNPDQADSNDDGIGDACEDFDGDAIMNLCDNCPTLTNSRQKDSNNDGFGDVCDGGAPGSCFLTPESLAGRLPSRPTAFGSMLFLAVAGLMAARRFRRK